MMEVARLFGRDAGVMSRGLRLLAERLAEEKELRRELVGCAERCARTGREECKKASLTPDLWKCGILPEGFTIMASG